VAWLESPNGLGATARVSIPWMMGQHKISRILTDGKFIALKLSHIGDLELNASAIVVIVAVRAEVHGKIERVTS
jgi:hypothetical protein